MKKKAIIVKSDDKYECRCYNCGKLLFTFSKKISDGVDKTAQNVIIVARCTRSSCKTDNVIVL